MSPFSHRGDQGRQSLAELGPVLQEVLNSVASVPVEQFAEQIMTRYFAAEQVMPSQVQV
jgi:hypothetical protein